jgi:hypothetical protein
MVLLPIRKPTTRIRAATPARTPRKAFFNHLVFWSMLV